MRPADYLSGTAAAAYRKQLDSTMAGMRQDRMSFWAHWSQLAEMFLPRRYKWFVQPNQWNRGSQMNSQIVDETGVLAARTLTSGMMSGMTSPLRPWFRLGLHDLEEVPYGPAKNYLAEVERRMMRVFSESNFYMALGTLYHDMGVFASGAMVLYEDDEQVIRCYNPCLGEFFFGAGPRLDIQSLYREFTLTVSQAVKTFGLENVSSQTREAYKQGGAQRTKEIVICHALEPNDELWADDQTPLQHAVPPSFVYRECYWERDAPVDQLCQISGYNEKPFVGGRWAATSNDAYGTGSPGMDALPAVRQLQIEQRRKAEAIDKLVRPPMVGSVSMKNEPASILPGAVNYVADIAGAGFKPAFQVDPRLAELTADLLEVQDRVNRMFFVDLFMMISQLDTVRTATEIDARKEEKLIQLGPVVERFENEVLDPIIDRVFAIMERRGLLPEPPPEIQGYAINVQYISMLAAAQRAAQTAAIERVLALAGNLAGVKPDILDKLDLDKTIEVYSNDLDLPPELIVSQDQVDANRQARAQQEQQAQALEATAPAAQAAKNLSDTQVGGGQNALELMLNE